MGSFNWEEIQCVVIQNPNASSIGKILCHPKRTLEDDDSIDSMCMSKIR